MPKRPAESLLSEAQGWIAEMLSDEGVIVTEAFVELVQEFEWDALEAGEVGPDDRAAMVQHVIDRCARENIMVGPIPSTLSTDGDGGNLQPRPVPADLVEQVLSWEDEFLGLAGITRRDGA